MVELVPLADRIGIEVRGIDVTRPIPDETFERIYRAWIDNTILLIRGQTMSVDQHVEFTRRFGEVVSYTRQEFAEGARPEILVLSNRVKDGKLVGSPVSGRVWHTDGHYLPEPPAGSMLYAVEVPPEGGDTLFANMFAAWEDLPDAVKGRIEGREVVISRVQSRPYNYPDRPAPSEAERAAWADQPQPMVLTHPENGRKALYVGGSVPWHVVGLDERESAPLVTFLQEFSILPRFTYRHRWQPGDIVLWDNRSAMHRATPYDMSRYHRHMHRTTLATRGTARH